MPVQLPTDLMASVSGFRGRVGAPLTPELVAAIAAAFGDFLEREGAGRTVYLGRDSRTSGAMFADAARAGLTSVGCDVVELGIVATPTLLLAAEEAGASGALGVTASHNPAEWNALKFGGPDGTFLDADRMSRFQDFLREAEIRRAPWDALGSLHSDDRATERHIHRILELPVLDVEGIRGRGFRVAIDCVHGAGGLVIPKLLDELGCEVVGIGLEPDGMFPRDPEPTAENLTELGELVVESGSELGFAIDPDVDRLSLVDESGVALGEDLTLALCAAVVVGRTPGPVVTNLSSSRVIEDVAIAKGGTVVRSPVGEINVARRMAAERAVIGGEGNGGVILPDLHYTRDAPLGCALILQHLLDESVGLREAANRWPGYSIVKEKVSFPRDRIAEAYAAIVGGFPPATADRADGLRLQWEAERAWLHVRPSGTEPVVRLIAEAPEEARAREIVSGARDLLGV